MDNKAQISAEFLIILAAVLAAALVLVSSLTSSAKNADAKVDSRAKQALDASGKTD